MVKNKIYQIINNVEEKENLYIFPIVGANKMLGFIAVWVSNNRKLEEIEHVALDYSSTVFALEWLKQEAVFETSQKIKGEFFKSIISGYLDEDVIIQANQLGFNSKDYFGVALFKSFNKDSKRLTVMENKRSNIFHYLNEYFNKEKIKGIVIPEKNYFCVLVSFTENKQTCIKKINNLSEKIINLYPELHVGIGRLYSGLNNSRNSYLEAKQCFTVMENYDFKKKIIYYGDLGILRFIYKHNEKEIIAYIKDTLFPVLEYDKQKGTDLMITLLEYVKFNKSLQSVAGKMNIHYNTGYSRIKKVEGLLDVKLNNAQDWFNIQAACKIYELLTPNYNEIEES
jgi:sugar diacid utilization regulator